MKNEYTKMTQEEANQKIIHIFQEKPLLKNMDKIEMKKIALTCDKNLMLKKGTTSISCLTFLLLNHSFFQLEKEDFFLFIEDFDFKKEKDDIFLRFIDCVLTHNHKNRILLNDLEIVKILNKIQIDSKIMIQIIQYNEVEKLYLSKKKILFFWNQLTSKEQENVFLFFTKPQIKKKLQYEIQNFQKEILFLLYDLNYHCPNKIKQELDNQEIVLENSHITIDIPVQILKNHHQWILQELEKKELINQLKKNLKTNKKNYKNTKI
jgi:hypothetical protein